LIQIIELHGTLSSLSLSLSLSLYRAVTQGWQLVHCKRANRPTTSKTMHEWQPRDVSSHAEFQNSIPYWCKLLCRDVGYQYSLLTRLIKPLRDGPRS
jgi:hypothetical protein